MPHQDTTADIKALARGIRASGIAIAKKANQLQLPGKTLEAEELSEPVQELLDLAEKLEAWRLHHADALRRLSLTVATQRAALEDFEGEEALDMQPREKALFHKAANITNGVAEELGDVAQQLDPHTHDEPAQAPDIEARALEALSKLASALEGGPDGDRVANTLHEAMDTIDGYGKWPEPSDLSDEFKAQIAIWHYKGNLRGGIDLTEEPTGEIHVTVADYVDMETLYSGGLYATWAAAYAAIGVALDARG